MKNYPGTNFYLQTSSPSYKTEGGQIHCIIPLEEQLLTHMSANRWLKIKCAKGIMLGFAPLRFIWRTTGLKMKIGAWVVLNEGFLLPPLILSLTLSHIAIFTPENLALFGPCLPPSGSREPNLVSNCRSYQTASPYTKMKFIPALVWGTWSRNHIWEVQNMCHAHFFGPL